MPREKKENVALTQYYTFIILYFHYISPCVNIPISGGESSRKKAFFHWLLFNTLKVKAMRIKSLQMRRKLLEISRNSRNSRCETEISVRKITLAYLYRVSGN